MNLLELLTITSTLLGLLANSSVSLSRPSRSKNGFFAPTRPGLGKIAGVRPISTPDFSFQFCLLRLYWISSNDWLRRELAFLKYCFRSRFYLWGSMIFLMEFYKVYLEASFCELLIDSIFGSFSVERISESSCLRLATFCMIYSGCISN